MRWLPVLLLLQAPAAQATPIVVDVDRIEATSTLKGDVRTLFDGGLWQGERKPKPGETSDSIRIDFAPEGAPIQGVNLVLCDDRRPDEPMHVSATFTQAAQLERLTSGECKAYLCYSFKETRSPVARITIDLGLNPQACLSRIVLIPVSTKGGLVIQKEPFGPLTREETELAQGRAQEHLDLLRRGSWEPAARLVHCAGKPKQPEKDAEMARKLAVMLKRIYGTVKPGAIVGKPALVETAHLNEDERRRIGRRIQFTYKHDDLDGLQMGWWRGQWFRELDNCP